MPEERLPINRLKQTSLPRTGESDKPRPVASERFTEEEMQEMLVEFARRFKETFRYANNAEIARALNTTDATVKYYSDALRFPQPEILIYAQQKTGINLHWLLTGKGSKRVEFGDMFTEDEEKDIQELARARGCSFNEMVRRLATGALEMVKRIEK